MIEYCVCSHAKECHKITPTYKLPFCTNCWNINDRKHLHTFKLDNLKLIEDLAKKKDLV